MTISKPKLRNNVTIDLQSLLYKIFYYDEYPFQNCLSCSHFTENTMFCKRWNARPPAKTIVYGCDEYDDIGVIPF